MLGRLIRLLVKVAVVSAFVWVGRKALMFWIDGPRQEPSKAPWPPIQEPEEPGAATQMAPADGAPADGAPADGAPADGAPAHVALAPEAPPDRAAGDSTDAWIPPDDSGACPATHPVKAKLSTRLYRLPGTASYDKATPDRCYASAEAAEADGFTRAKR